MWNPFKRAETRASYTDSLVNLLVRQASGSPIGSASETAAAEAAVSLWSSAFAGARLEPEVPALDPFTLSRIARDLVVSGESLHVIDVEGGGLKLLPVGDHDVQGRSPDPATWLYRCSLYGPDGGTVRTVPSAGVVHVLYSADPASPWKGKGPLARSNLDAGLLSALTTRMGEEAGASSAIVIPSPVDGQADSVAMLRADLAKARGGIMLLETMASGYGDKASAPQADWSVKRLGSMIPDANRALASETGERLMEALGVPSALLVAGSAGIARREALRMWVSCRVAPLGRIVAAELADKLDLPGLTLDFGPLAGSDLVGRAASAKRMVEAGMPAEKAFALSGLVAADE